MTLLSEKSIISHFTTPVIASESHPFITLTVWETQQETRNGLVSSLGQLGHHTIQRIPILGDVTFAQIVFDFADGVCSGEYK